MSYNVGLQVHEGLAKGFTSFTEPSKRNIALLMARERGVPNILTPLDSLDKDRTIFGAEMTGSYGAIVTRNFFRNTGGFLPVLYGMRIVGDATVASTTTIATGDVTLSLVSAYEGQEDPGTWGNKLTAILHNKNSRLKGKWVLEVFYDGILVETYTENTLEAIVEGTQTSKFLAISTADDLTEAALNPMTNSGETLSSATNSVNLLLSGDITGIASDSEAEGFVLYTASGDKIGTIASYDSVADTVVLNALPLVDISSSTVFYIQTDSAFTGSFTGGVYNAPVESDFYGTTAIGGVEKGLNILKGEDVQIFAVTEFATQTMAVEANAFAEENDMLHVCSLPENATLTTASSYASVLQNGTRNFTAAYHGWVKTSTGGSTYGYAPALGCILGAGYVKATGLLGDFVHIPPAGQNSSFTDIVDMKPSKLSQQDIDRMVQDHTVNVVKFQKGLGYFLISSRTMSTNALYHSIHIRLQSSFYRRVLLENMGFILQRPNTQALRRDAYTAAYAYFSKEYSNGALEDSVPFEKACEIIIDQRNNPVGQDRKLLNLDINWIPTEAVEAFKISLNRNDGALLVTESNTN